MARYSSTPLLCKSGRTTPQIQSRSPPRFGILTSEGPSTATGGRTEKPEADESAHEIREIAGVEVRVSAEDLFDDEPEAEAEPEPEPEPDIDFTPPVAMFDLQTAEQSVSEPADEQFTEPVGMDLTHEAEVEEEALMDSEEMVSESSEDVGELDLDSLLANAPPPKPRIEAPADAQVNEHGQKVWRDEEGDVWVQNPDGSLKIEGADYYYFFAVLMFVTAVLFTMVSRYYKPTSYFQKEQSLQN